MSDTMTALLFPSSIRVLMRMWFTVVNAVSADEKKADNASRIIIKINCVILSVSKKSTPLKIFFSTSYQIIKEMSKILGIFKNA